LQLQNNSAIGVKKHIYTLCFEVLKSLESTLTTTAESNLRTS